MSFAKSKNEFSKKDMNFFSEFSSGASQQISSVFPFFLLLTVLILGVTLIVWIVCGIQVMQKQDKIDEIRAEMASAEYKQKLSNKDKSQVEVENLRQYYYVLSTLDSRVAESTVSSVETLVACKNALPDDAILTDYHDEDGVVEIGGITLRRDSGYNYAKLLEDTGIFSFIEESIAVADPIEKGYNKDTLMFADVQYVFSFKCTISGHFTLSYAYFLDGTVPTPLSELKTESFMPGADYSIGNVKNIEIDGVKYTLSNVKINGTAVDSDKLNTILSEDAFSGRIGSNMDVQFMYKKADDSNGGES